MAARWLVRQELEAQRWLVRNRARVLTDWIDEPTAARALVRKGLYEAVPVRGAWWYTLGSATLPVWK